MGGTFVITLREGFEAALVLGLIYTYLEKIGARREFRYVTVGALLGIVASFALGVMVTVLSGPLVDLGPDLIGAVVLLLRERHAHLARLVDAAACARRSRRARAAHRRRQGPSAVLGRGRDRVHRRLPRRGRDRALPLGATDTGRDERRRLAARSRRPAGRHSARSCSASLVFRGARQISLRRFFAWTSVFLLLLAAGLFSTGVGRLQGLGLLPARGHAVGHVGLARRPQLPRFAPRRAPRLPRSAIAWEAGAYVAYLVVGRDLDLRRGATRPFGGESSHGARLRNARTASRRLPSRQPRRKRRQARDIPSSRALISSEPSGRSSSCTRGDLSASNHPDGQADPDEIVPAQPASRPPVARAQPATPSRPIEGVHLISAARARGGDPPPSPACREASQCACSAAVAVRVAPVPPHRHRDRG